MITSGTRRKARWLLRISVAVGVVAGIHLAEKRLPVTSARIQSETFVPSPQMAKLLSFGFDAALSDLNWMRAIQIVGAEAGAAGQSHVLAALIDLVTTLDPWVGHPYRFAAIWITDDEAAVRKANVLIRRGIEHHPEDWRGYFYLAFNHFFYLNEQAEAARVLEPALALEGRPEYLTRLHARLYAQSGGLDAAAAFLSEMAQQASDDAEREKFAEALLEVETERRARFLDEARAEYARRHQRDIAAVEDLISGGVLRALPPDPFGEGWQLSAETAQIVSKHVRYRYGVKLDAGSRRILEQFRERSRQN
jgi:uncharacterized protein (DUF924 family)